MPDAIPNGNFSPYLAQAFMPQGFAGGLGGAGLGPVGWQQQMQPFGQSPFAPGFQQPWQQGQQFTAILGGMTAGRLVQPPVYVDIVQAAELLARVLPLAAAAQWRHQLAAQMALSQFGGLGQLYGQAGFGQNIGQFGQPYGGWQQLLPPQLAWQQHLPQQAMSSPFGLTGASPYGTGQTGPFTGQGDGIGRILPFLAQQPGLGMGYSMAHA